MRRSRPFRLVFPITGALALAGCRGDIFYDDYRESWAVIRGRVLDQADRPVAGAGIRTVAVLPGYARGDSVTSASDGGYVARVSAFGVPDFRADVRLSVTTATGATADTVVTGLYVAERDRGGKPDTLDVVLRVRP
jgi:hypothetical protein